MGCNRASNANREHGPIKSNESPSENEDSLSAENAHCSIRNESGLSLYEIQKALSFQMLNNHFSDSIQKSRITLI